MVAGRRDILSRVSLSLLQPDMAQKDTDELALIVLRRTLYLWIFPYIFWYFGKRIYRAVVNWVTEPPPRARR